MVLTIENAVYRKTGTCHDINVLDNSFSCFNVEDYELINCSVGSSPDITVFCYLYAPNVGAPGIAYGTVKIILIGVFIYFKIANRVGRLRCCDCFGDCCCFFRGFVKCCCDEYDCQAYFFFWLFLILQSISMVLIPIAVAVTFPSLHYLFAVQFYFFQGTAVMRYSMFVLTVVTTFALLPVPWCCFVSTIYRDTVVDLPEKTSNTSDKKSVKNVPEKTTETDQLKSA